MGLEPDGAFRALFWRSTRAFEGAGPAYDLPDCYWVASLARLGLSRLARDDWTADATEAASTMARAGRIVFRSASRDGHEDAVLEVGSALVLVSLRARGRLTVVAAAHTDRAANEALSRLREAFPKQVPQGCRVAMTFWSYGHGPRSDDETLDVCRWREIDDNYAARTRASLDALMRTEAVAGSGKLVLWLGPPGTGKTYALRALAWEQRENISIHYILDPETFLERVDYIMALFRDASRFGHDGFESEEDDEERARAKRAKLVVLEDAGELLGADARSRVGQGLSRLLNLTDGLPGQAARTRVLITTNEDVGRLHPAVTRPGRCAALVRFSPLDDAEAAAWLRARGHAPLASERRPSSTIADLFALVRGDRTVVPASASVGFGRPR